MNRNYFLAIIAVAICCVVLIFISMWQKADRPVPQENLTPYPFSPFKSYITGVGIVEASSENIFIGSPVNRLIENVLVRVGDKVKKGDILFQLENRDLEADLTTRQVAHKIARAKLQKLEALPRPEDVFSNESALRRAQLELDQAKSQYEMVLGLQDTRALSQQEVNRRRFNYEQAEAKWHQAQADLNKVKAGTWKPDLEIASLEALQAQTNVERIKTDIERTFVRSPINGNVLQIKIHEGEFPPIDTSKAPLMIVGNIEDLHLLVSINQFDAPHFRPNASAVAFLQGDSRIEFSLEFVRLEPYLVNKQNLTNDIMEKIDTHVLQVIYRFKKNTQRLYVGQQMDVFIETEHAL